MSVSTAEKFGCWLRCLLQELDCSQSQSTPLMEDNQGALVWGGEGVRHSKHIVMGLTFVKEQVDRQYIRLEYCPTQEIVADIFTKLLLRVSFEKHRDSLCVLPQTA